jgi:hypothetical protein
MLKNVAYAKTIFFKQIPPQNHNVAHSHNNFYFIHHKCLH